MTQPCLSVVMPAYNAETHIHLALDSLLAQTEQQFEIVIIDDGSSDATAEIARSYRHDGWPHVSVISQNNAGVSAARNVGIRAARAPLIGFLDADDLWAPSKIARHLELMERCEDVDLSFSSFGYIDTDGAALIDQSIIKQGRYGHDDLMPRNFIHTSTVIARRDALLMAGGFDESLVTYEDFDLWLRIAGQRDHNLYAIGDTLAQYRRHTTQTTGQWHKMHEGWTRVADRLARDHPKAWGKVAKSAWAHQYEYVASLAYNAGDIAQMRAFMKKAWQVGGLELFKRQNAAIMVGVAVASYLPRPLQIVIGWAFTHMRVLTRKVLRTGS